MTDMLGLGILALNLLVTLTNLAILGLAVKLYTDQTKQAILRGSR